MHNRFTIKDLRALSPVLVLLWGSLAIVPVEAQTLTVLYTFTGGADGGAPFGTPLLFSGNIYGTTKGGGAHNAGTVYEVNFASKHEAVLHSFAGEPTDGSNPLAGLIQDLSGNLYGTTFNGGAYGYGTVFELALPPKGKFTLLHSFAGPPGEGAGPAAPLTFDSAYNIYGTTYVGGSSAGYGTTFELETGGSFITGQSFPPDGALPHGGLFGMNGKFYGTTSGSDTSAYGGTIFESGTTTPLYTFTGGADGGQPIAGLIGDAAGNLYGTTEAGGSASFGRGNGVVFSFSTVTGKLTVLHTFNGSDGTSPMGTLARDPAGNLYGTTEFGGASGYGTVFKLDPSGNLTTIYSFTGGTDGARPASGLVVDSKGNIWGTASGGGANGAGTLFIIAPAAT